MGAIINFREKLLKKYFSSQKAEKKELSNVQIRPQIKKLVFLGGGQGGPVNVRPIPAPWG